jgi:hypothetical protein
VGDGAGVLVAAGVAVGCGVEPGGVVGVAVGTDVGAAGVEVEVGSGSAVGEDVASGVGSPGAPITVGRGCGVTVAGRVTVVVGKVVAGVVAVAVGNGRMKGVGVGVDGRPKGFGVGIGANKSGGIVGSALPCAEAHAAAVTASIAGSPISANRLKLTFIYLAAFSSVSDRRSERFRPAPAQSIPQIG